MNPFTNKTIKTFFADTPEKTYRVEDEAAAIALANDSPFGLGGSVFTDDIERGKRVADQIDTGMVFINHPTWTAPELPFGGARDPSAVDTR